MAEIRVPFVDRVMQRDVPWGITRMPNVEFRTGEFRAALVYDGFEKGSSIARILLRDLKDGARFTLTLTDFDHAIRKAPLVVVVESELPAWTGTWRFKKHGTAFSLRFVGP